MHDKCHVTHFTKEVVLETNVQTKAVTLYVTGMDCINCANRVHNGLIDHPGVIAAEVSHVTGKAEVTYIPAKVGVPELMSMVTQAADHRHTYRAVGCVFEAGGSG